MYEFAPGILTKSILFISVPLFLLYPAPFLCTPTTSFAVFISTPRHSVCECVCSLTGACFRRFVAAMLTFFVGWPAFHICAGQSVLFALTIMGDPQLLFRTLEEPLKCLCCCAMLRRTEKTLGRGVGGGWCLSKAFLSVFSKALYQFD